MKDIITCRFGNPFGPAIIFSGYIMILSGIAITFLIAPGGLILIFAGAFMVFTHSATQINVKEYRVKHTNNLFGIFAIGNWVDIAPDMKLVIRNASGVYNVYSRSNRQLTVPKTEYQLVICQCNGKECIPVLKSKNLKQLKEDSKILARKIGVAMEN